MQLDEKHVIITGVGGFIGSRLAARLLDLGVQVTGIDDFSSGHRENVPNGVTLVKGNLADTGLFNTLTGSYDYICHLAGQSSGEISFDSPVADLEKNTVTTLNLIHFGIEKCVKKLIYASSMSIYGSRDDKPTQEDAVPNPISCYGVGKLAGENYLKIFAPQLPFVDYIQYSHVFRSFH